MNNSRNLKPETGNLKLLLALLLLFSALRTPHSALSQTPVFYSAPGQTNQVVLTAWPPPPSGNNWVQYGTNTIYLGVPITNTPSAAGWFSNSFYPTLYKVSIPAYGSGAFFYANIYNTTNYNSLGFYATNIVVANNVLSAAQLIAAMLGYTPQPALGYVPATNSYSALTNILGFVPATNGGQLAYSQLPYTPPTNNYAGLTNVLGFTPATNNPQTFTWTNAIAVAGITNSTGAWTNAAVTLQTNSVTHN